MVRIFTLEDSVALLVTGVCYLDRFLDLGVFLFSPSIQTCCSSTCGLGSGKHTFGLISLPRATHRVHTMHFSIFSIYLALLLRSVAAP